MLIHPNTIALTTVLLCTAFLFSPVMAQELQITRSISPQSPESGDIVTVTIDLPPSFFGGVIENIPEGFSYEGTDYPQDAIRQQGKYLIFAVTGEEKINYKLRMPDSGCGYLTGEWEDFKTSQKGKIEDTFLATPGIDISSCACTAQTPGFAVLQAFFAIFATLFAINIRKVTDR